MALHQPLPAKNRLANSFASWGSPSCGRCWCPRPWDWWAIITGGRLVHSNGCGNASVFRKKMDCLFSHHLRAELATRVPGLR